MGTRAVYTFKDNDSEFHVYKHYDGHPDNVNEYMERAKEYAWRLPRFEADEFACAFIKANKDSEGDVRLTNHWKNHGDLSYRYEITLDNNDKLNIKTFEC